MWQWVLALKQQQLLGTGSDNRPHITTQIPLPTTIHVRCHEGVSEERLVQLVLDTCDQLQSPYRHSVEQGSDDGAVARLEAHGGAEAVEEWLARTSLSAFKNLNDDLH